MAALTQHVCGWLSPGAARRVKRTPTRGLAPVTAAAVGAGASAAPAGTPSHTRRDVLAAAVALAAFAPAAARAEEGTVLVEGVGAAQPLGEAAAPAVSGVPAAVVATPVLAAIEDKQLAYSFRYPTSTSTGREVSWVTTREPCRYSSAAPLSADARQRIVCELVNFKGPLTASVTVGPPPPVLELLGPQSGWTPKQVVAALLADRSTGRVSTGQRVSMASLESVSAVDVGGAPYFYFETVAQGSPNFVDPKAQTFRRALGVVACREGYYYTMMITAPERLWDECEAGFKASVQSFRLDAPTDEFRAPDTPSLQFW